MVKYFIKNTEKEIKEGDTIEISLSKEFPKGFKEHRVFTLTFHNLPIFIETLTEIGVIEKREVKEETPDAKADCSIRDILKDFEQRITDLESIVADLRK